jgi:hypothetical protein
MSGDGRHSSPRPTPATRASPPLPSSPPCHLLVGLSSSLFCCKNNCSFQHPHKRTVPMVTTRLPRQPASRSNSALAYIQGLGCGTLCPGQTPVITQTSQATHARIPPSPGLLPERDRERKSPWAGVHIPGVPVAWSGHQTLVPGAHIPGCTGSLGRRLTTVRGLSNHPSMPFPAPST